MRTILKMCPNHGKQCAVPPSLEDWSRHSTARKGSSRLPSHSLCLHSLPQSLKAAPSYGAMAWGSTWLLNLLQAHIYHPVCNVPPPDCTLEPGSNRVAVGLKNISSRPIKIPSGTVVCQLQQAKMVPKIQKASTKEQNKQGPNGGKEGSWVLDQLNLESLEAWTADH